MKAKDQTQRYVVQLPDGQHASLVTTPAGYKELTGDPRDERSIRRDCEAGIIPCLPRHRGSGAHHRIATAKALELLGVPYEIVASRPA